ncbi:unnamed protein product [Closterium sp. NIES-54]
MGKGGSLPPALIAQPKSYSGLSTLEIEPDTTAERPRILGILSSILDHVVSRNEAKQAKSGDRKLTVFHGLRAPAITVEKYLERIFKYANCSPACFVVAYAYIDRILQEHDDMVITSLNVHRLLITCIMVAAKFLDDSIQPPHMVLMSLCFAKAISFSTFFTFSSYRYFNNAYYAKVGGVTTAEMNRLEMELLFRMDFRLNITTDVFYAYCKRLEAEIWNSRPPFEATMDVNSLSMLKPPGHLARVQPCHVEVQKGVRTPPREVESYRYPSMRARTLVNGSP